jgi:hypothetical protein
MFDSLGGQLGHIELSAVKAVIKHPGRLRIGTMS